MFEIGDGEIDVEGIMAKIREDIKRRNAIGRELCDADAAKASPRDPLPFSSGMVNYHVNLLRILQDPKPQGPIASHGNFVIEVVKRFIRRLLAPYHRAIFTRQAEFNANVVRLMAELLHAIDRSVGERLAQLGDRLTETRREMIGLSQNLELTLQEIDVDPESDQNSLVSAGSARNSFTNRFYFRIADLLRGSRDEIKKRQELYLPIFEKKLNTTRGIRSNSSSVILDVGCGRGEFLELLRDHGIPAKGIDMNEHIVQYCRGRGLDVELADVFNYLPVQADDSLRGIIACQVIEHFQTHQVLRFLKLCYRKLEKGGTAVFETVNPLSVLTSAANFYIDPSHVRPVHPVTLQALAECIGFINTEIRFLAPYPDELKLQLVRNSEGASGQINENFKRLNEILFGYQDYGVICEK